MNKFQQAIIKSVDTIVSEKMKKEGVSYYFNAKVVDHDSSDTYTVANTPHLCSAKEKSNCANCPYGFNSQSSLANHEQQIKRIKDSDNVCIGYFTNVYFGLKPRSGLIPSTGQVAQILVKNGDFSTKVIDDILNGVGTISGGGVNKVSLYPPLSLNLSVDNVGYNDATLSWNTPTQLKPTLGGYTLVFGQGTTPPYPSYHITVDIDKGYNTNTITKLTEGTTYTAWILARDIYGNFIQCNNYDSIQTFTTPVRTSGSGGHSGGSTSGTSTIEEQMLNKDFTIKEVLLPTEFSATNNVRTVIDKYGNVYVYQYTYDATRCCYYYDVDNDSFTKLVGNTDSEDMMVSGYETFNKSVIVRTKEKQFNEYDKGELVHSYIQDSNDKRFINDYYIDKNNNRLICFQQTDDGVSEGGDGGIFNENGVQYFQNNNDDGENFYNTIFLDANDNACTASYYYNYSDSLNGIYRLSGTTFTKVAGANGARWKRCFKDSQGKVYITHDEFTDDMSASYGSDFAIEGVAKGVWVSRPNGTWKFYGIDGYRLYNFVETTSGVVFCSSTTSKSLGLWMYNQESDSFVKIYTAGMNWNVCKDYIDNNGDNIALLATTESVYGSSLTILKYNITQNTYDNFVVTPTDTNNNYCVESMVDMGDYIQIILSENGNQFKYYKVDGSIQVVDNVMGGYPISNLYYNYNQQTLYYLDRTYQFNANYPDSNKRIQTKNNVGLMISSPNNNRITMLLVIDKEG